MPRAPSENNKQTQKEIMSKIVQIKEMNKNFLSIIGKLENTPRDKLVEQDYSEKCEKQAPWLMLRKKNGEIIEEKQESEGNLSDRQNQINKLLENIDSSPKKRNQLIKQFLEQNSVIEKPDQEIIIKSYENLSNDKLEKEILSIMEIFGK